MSSDFSITSATFFFVALMKPFIFSLLADGDPHFVVEFPLSKLTVCFNINGEPGHILRLVSDHKASGNTPNTSC